MIPRRRIELFWAAARRTVDLAIAFDGGGAWQRSAVAVTARAFQIGFDGMRSGAFRQRVLDLGH